MKEDRNRFRIAATNSRARGGGWLTIKEERNRCRIGENENRKKGEGKE